MNTLPGHWGIGVDIGGTKIAAGLIDLVTGDVIATRRAPTQPQRGARAVLADVLALAGELHQECRALGRQASCVGIGLAELVDAAGDIQSAHSIDWSGIRLREALNDIAPAWIESDVRSAALAEARFGAGRQYRDFAYLSIGSGISSCFVKDGVPHAGARGNALVMTSGPVTVPCPHCGQPARVVVEEISSGPALAAAYAAATGRAIDGAEIVLVDAEAGNQTAERIVQAAAIALGSNLGLLVNILDPEAVVVGGGLGAGSAHYRALVEMATRDHIWSESTRALPFVPAELGAASGTVGAALAAWNHLQTTC